MMEQQLHKVGLGRTIYSLLLPETQNMVEHVLGNKNSVERFAFLDMYSSAWTGKQDAAHLDFFESWKKWVAPVVHGSFDEFKFSYPTAGASEGIRESIHTYAHRGKAENFTPRIHVFAGEYEGYAAYAATANIEIITHDRNNWTENLKHISSTDQFYISQPSSLDGNIWDEFDDFATALYAHAPKAQIMLDLVYIGCVAKSYTINIAHPNIETLFFSLSKPFGAYYHRIGGCLSKSELNGLFGNKWFKNLFALKLGCALMNRYDVYELARKYSAKDQIPFLNHVKQQYGLTALQPADVYFLATGKANPKDGDLEHYLYRGSENTPHLRVCLTPGMYERIHNTAPALKEVTA